MPLMRLRDRKSTRLNSSHRCISYAVFCLKKVMNSSGGALPGTFEKLVLTNTGSDVADICGFGALRPDTAGGEALAPSLSDTGNRKDFATPPTWFSDSG